MDRNEALEIVRKNWPKDIQYTEALRTLIPELKENEDERIRKEIIHHIQNCDDTIDEETEKRMIAWLEKQGEQKPVPFKAEHGKYYYCIKDYFSGGKKQASKGDVVQALRGLPIMGLDDASEFFLPVNDMQLNNGINHNNCPKFKVGDKIKLVREPKYPAREIIAIHDDAYYFDELVHLPFSYQDEWELVGQKPAEKIEQNSAWSEEDEITTQRIIDTIWKYATSPHSIINGDKPNLEYAEEFESWLKSLKDRVQPNHWKPSEKQIEALGNATAADDEQGEALTSLYNDLKALCEK